MLALTRKAGESIVIGDNIEITVLAVNGDQIKLGIDAPRNISIHRKEIFEQIKEENKIAAKTTENQVAMLRGFSKKETPKEQK